jgi:ring-1,2-phenylacetyl-CoA epoxidase subunit PaaE
MEQSEQTLHGASSPSPRVRGEGRGEGPLPGAPTLGDAPSPGVREGADADFSPQAGRGEARAVAPRFHNLTVAEVRRETADAVSVVFAVPAHLAADYAFEPGQYLTLKATLDGEEVRRSYSICTAPDAGELRIAVKRVDTGAFSGFVNDELKAGDTLDVMTPTGRFGLAATPGDSRVHVAFAAGSGITPVLSILRGVLAREPKSRFFLFYGNRSSADVLFLEELEELKDRHLGRLSLFHVLSREEQDIPVRHGRLDSDKVRRLLSSLVPAAAVDHAFVCGPAGMIDDIVPVMESLGVPAARIHVERFVSAHGGRPRPPRAVAADAPPAHMAAVIVDGKRRDVPVAAGEAIIDAALRAGIELPFACKGGMCCTCRAKLVEGSVEMAVNYSLQPWELEAGYILTCQARPTTERVVVDYDQV